MAQGENIMTPKRLEILRGFAADSHGKPWILELVQEIDNLSAQLATVTKERDAALSEIARLTHELSVCDECAGKHLERAEKAEVALAAGVRRI